MNNLFYYLVASLPHLSFAQSPPFPGEDFLSICSKALGNQVTILREVLESEENDIPHSIPNAIPVVDQWIQWNDEIKHELARYRASYLEFDLQDDIQKKTSKRSTLELLNAIKNEHSPLEREIIYERFRWNFLEELEVGQHFNLETLIIYALKLKILERLSTFDLPRGTEAFQQILNQLYHPVFESISTNLAP